MKPINSLGDSHLSSSEIKFCFERLHIWCLPIEVREMWCDYTEAIQTQVPYSKGHPEHSTWSKSFDNAAITYPENWSQAPHFLLLTFPHKTPSMDSRELQDNIWSFCSNLTKIRLSISSPQTLEGTSNCKGAPWEDPAPKAFGRAAAVGCCTDTQWAASITARV